MDNGRGLEPIRASTPESLGDECKSPDLFGGTTIDLNATNLGNPEDVPSAQRVGELVCREEIAVPPRMVTPNMPADDAFSLAGVQSSGQRYYAFVIRGH